MAEQIARAEGLGVTIKTGKGYDDTWLTFTGSPEQVRSLIKGTFDLDDTDLTLFELVQNATNTAHGVASAVKGLGGTVVKGHNTTPDEAQQTTQQDEPASEDVDPYVALNNEIAALTDVDSLRRLYADNTAMFTADTDEAKAAKAAWKARGKALQQAA